MICLQICSFYSCQLALKSQPYSSLCQVTVRAFIKHSAAIYCGFLATIIYHYIKIKALIIIMPSMSAFLFCPPMNYGILIDYNSASVSRLTDFSFPLCLLFPFFCLLSVSLPLCLPRSRRGLSRTSCSTIMRATTPKSSLWSRGLRWAPSPHPLGTNTNTTHEHTTMLSKF